MIRLHPKTRALCPIACTPWPALPAAAGQMNRSMSPGACPELRSSVAENDPMRIRITVPGLRPLITNHYSLTTASPVPAFLITDHCSLTTVFTYSLTTASPVPAFLIPDPCSLIPVFTYSLTTASPVPAFLIPDPCFYPTPLSFTPPLPLRYPPPAFRFPVPLFPWSLVPCFLPTPPYIPDPTPHAVL